MSIQENPITVNNFIAASAGRVINSNYNHEAGFLITVILIEIISFLIVAWV